MQEHEKKTQQNSLAGVLQQEQKVAASPRKAALGVDARLEAQVRPRVSPEQTRREAPTQTQQSPNTNPRTKGQESPRPAQAAPRVATHEKPAGPQANASQQVKKLGYSPFVPLLVVALTMLAMVTFQTIQLSKDREVLTTVKANQEAAVIESQKIRLQFESIAKNTGQLAANGNKNAQAIVDQLRQQGITVNLTAGPAQ